MTDLSSDDIPLATPIVDEEAAMDVEALLLDRSSVLVIIGAHTNSIKTYQPVKNKNENCYATVWVTLFFFFFFF